MNVKTESIVSGKIEWLEVRDKHGNLKTRLEDIPNIILNTGLTTQAVISSSLSIGYAYTSTAESYDDIDGTWSQTGNTVTRATGTGIFPSSPSKIGDELYWYDAGANTGHRCHVTARASDTSITVSGLAKTITGGKIRRFSVNGSGVSAAAGSAQVSASQTMVSDVKDYVAGTREMTIRYNFNSSASAYTLGSVRCGDIGRVKLPSTVAIDVEDQLTFLYAITETCAGRSQDYELGAESTGIPQKHSMTSIVGNGTNVDVTFSAATHFLAGDKLDLRNVTTKKHSISSASSTSTTFTINTATAHGLSVSDSVTIENASLAGYNGVFTVSAVVDSDTFEITDAANPGAMGASGTARLTTPATYFDDLGLATIASMVSSSVARITSAITGPAVEPGLIGGDPGVSVRFWPKDTACIFNMSGSLGNGYSGFRTATNAIALKDPTTPSTASNANVVAGDTVNMLFSNATFANDWTCTGRLEWNAGAGKTMSRMKQVQIADQNASGLNCQITFNTPFDKPTTHRLRIDPVRQIKRTLDLTGLP